MAKSTKKSRKGDAEKAAEDKAAAKAAKAADTLTEKAAKLAVQQARQGQPVSSAPTLSSLLRIPSGVVDMTTLDADASAGYPGKGKKDAADHTMALEPRLADLQERLFAAGRANPETAPRVLVVLQGMDTSGKGGIIRHAIGMVDPQGVHIKSFKAPTPAERRHHYLWRIRREAPGPGMIGIFDRSHYEDVLIVRVNELVKPEVWGKRYDELNHFEAELAEQGTKIVKCFLNVSRDQQRERLLARLDDPTKYWKYNTGDLDSRAKWDDYMTAYADALTKCNTEVAPWYHVPANRKWYRNWAVATLLAEALESLNLQWPPADFDVDAEIERVKQS